MPDYTALLAEDVDELLHMTKIALERTGRVEVVGTASNGKEATAQAADLQPDLVLLDISMPVQDGLEALPRILEVSPHSKVVILSGLETERLGPVALSLGAASYIEKGASPTEIAKLALQALDEAEVPEEVDLEPESDEKDEKDELLSIVAHEFRQPLAVITGFGLTLQQRWDNVADEERKRIVERMTLNARYLDAVLTNVLQLRSGTQFKVNVSTCPIDELVASLADDMRSFAKDHPVVVEIEDGLPDVAVDQSRMRQVLTNLVVNATKFAPAETPITLSARAHEKGVALSVADLGPGIPPENRAEMFGRFVKGDPKTKGLGLGLFISRTLMEDMGGDIYIEDVPQGLTVTCVLPRA